MFSKKQKILCVNCGICINQMNKRLLAEQNTNVVTVLALWISPRLIAEDDYICKSCWTKAFDVVNESLTMKIIKTEMPEEAANSVAIEPLESKRVVGHQLVCISCGRSLAQRRHSCLLPESPTELQLSVFNLITKEYPERKIKPNDVICFACLLRVHRKLKKINTRAESRQSELIMDIEIKNESEENPQVKTSQKKLNEDNADLSDSSDKEWKPSKSYTTTQLTENKEKQYIVLSNYKRCAAGSSKCIFKKCTSRFRHCIPDNLRRKLLIDNNLYLPKSCRICDEHLEINKYNELLTYENTSTFSSEHIEHLLSILNTESNVDFDDVLNIEDHLFQYLFDMTKNNFINIFNDIPKLKDIHRSELGLAGLIMKYKKNDPVVKLAKLMRTPRATLEAHMKSVKKLVMSRMAKLEKDEETSEKQDEPIIFTPQEVLDYFKSHSNQDEPCKKKKKGNDRKTV